MILDNNALFSDQQTLLASAPSTNTLDFGVNGKTAYNSVSLVTNIGMGNNIPLLIQITETVNNATSITIDVQTAAASSFASPKNVVSLTVLLADLKAGYILPIVALPRGIKQRYLRLNYTVTGTAPTTGKITAGIVMDVDGAYRG